MELLRRRVLARIAESVDQPLFVLTDGQLGEPSLGRRRALAHRQIHLIRVTTFGNDLSMPLLGKP